MVTQLCDALQCFTTSGPDPCPVPHLGLSTVNPDASVRVHVLLQRSANGADAMWVWSDDVNVVKEGANHFILPEFFLSGLQGGTLAWVSLLASFSLWDQMLNPFRIFPQPTSRMGRPLLHTK